MPEKKYTRKLVPLRPIPENRPVGMSRVITPRGRYKRYRPRMKLESIPENPTMSRRNKAIGAIGAIGALGALGAVGYKMYKRSKKRKKRKKKKKRKKRGGSLISKKRRAIQLLRSL